MKRKNRWAIGVLTTVLFAGGDQIAADPLATLSALVDPVTLALADTTSTAADPRPAVGTVADPLNVVSADGIEIINGGFAIPLAAASPEWLTDELLAQVLAARGQPVLAPSDAPLPSEVGIRPGGWMISPGGCTMNFIFRDGAGNLAIGTAGHCVDKIGDSVVLLTLLPGGGPAVMVDIGTVIFRREAGIGEDFALVRIRPELYSWVSPTISLVGGPCGSYTGTGPEVVFHYGHGIAIGTGGTPRAGVSLNWTREAYGWDGLAIFGDSGSPARVSDFKAAGNVTHLVVDTDWLPSYLTGTRITHILEMIPGLRLVDSPLCTSSVAPSALVPPLSIFP